jgi:hypothetical protein
MAEGNPIGEYLRARRELLRPEDVGIPDVDRHRVPGLRRSELAMLAGITSHLHELAAPAPRRPRRRRSKKVSSQIDALLRSLDRTTPAYVTGRLMDVLAANELATAVLPLGRVVSTGRGRSCRPTVTTRMPICSAG